MRRDDDEDPKTFATLRTLELGVGGPAGPALLKIKIVGVVCKK
jgi:hypothetical protein